MDDSWNLYDKTSFLQLLEKTQYGFTRKIGFNTSNRSWEADNLYIKVVYTKMSSEATSSVSISEWTSPDGSITQGVTLEGYADDSDKLILQLKARHISGGHSGLTPSLQFKIDWYGVNHSSASETKSFLPQQIQLVKFTSPAQTSVTLKYTFTAGLNQRNDCSVMVESNTYPATAQYDYYDGDLHVTFDISETDMYQGTRLNFVATLVMYPTELSNYASAGIGFIKLTTNPNGEEANNYVETIWRMIKDRYIQEYCFDIPLSTDVINDDNFKLQARLFFRKMISIFSQTYDRYALVMKSYMDRRANLLDKVEAITRFNDTPQDTGEFADDKHTTHITTTKNDYDTLMGRLKEIQDSYNKVLRDWVEEFSCLFIHEQAL